jgi:hypothetical protein
MRLRLLPQSKLSTQQRTLYQDMRAGIEANFKGFIAIDQNVDSPNSADLCGSW